MLGKILNPNDLQGFIPGFIIALQTEVCPVWCPAEPCLSVVFDSEQPWEDVTIGSVHGCGKISRGIGNLGCSL